MKKQSELEKDLRLMCKWVFYILIATGIYFALKFINEQEITVGKLEEDFEESSVKAVGEGIGASKVAINKGTNITKDAIKKGTELTKDFIAIGVDITKSSVKQKLNRKTKPDK